jgi:hypothetical protein
VWVDFGFKEMQKQVLLSAWSGFTSESAIRSRIKRHYFKNILFFLSIFQEEQWQAVDYTHRHDELESLIYEMESMGIVTFNTVVVFRMYIISVFVLVCGNNITYVVLLVQAACEC